MEDDVRGMAFDDSDFEDDRRRVGADDHREAIVKIEDADGIAVCVQDVVFAGSVLESRRRDDGILRTIPS